MATIKEKIGYALGDAAAGGITWKIMSIAFPLFFTNVFGLTFADTAALMLLARLFDVVEADYHQMRIITPWWDYDIVAETNGMEGQPNPYSFTYEAADKENVDRTGAMSIVGWGISITKITFQ